MNVKKIGAAKIATAAVLSAAALAVYVVESLFPPLILPGAKMGLSNVFVLLALVCLGVGYAFAALAVKIAVGNLIVGNFSTLMYSLPAGAISLAVMSLLFFNGKIPLRTDCFERCGSGGSQCGSKRGLRSGHGYARRFVPLALPRVNRGVVGSDCRCGDVFSRLKSSPSPNGKDCSTASAENKKIFAREKLTRRSRRFIFKA